MNNYVQDGDVVELAAPYDRESGEGALIGELFGVATVKVLNGAKANFKTKGVVEIAKIGSQAWTAGDKIYWDNGSSPKQATKTSGANKFIGYATEAVAGGANDLKGKVLLIPDASAQAAAVAFSAGANLTGVDGTGSNAAPLAGTETRLDALDTAVAAILTALKNAKLMAT